jgi:outer membrane protein OmpU|tara:strand:- start:5349 stop:6182 length:834 start_codon:yes stop_codon:yes gene_type:complete
VSDTQFHSDLDVRFTLSGESDNGLTFGATIDLDEIGDDDPAGVPAGDPIAANPNNGDPVEELAVFVSGGFGTVTLGDVDGALAWALADLEIAAGAIADDHTEHGGFSEADEFDGLNDGQILRYDYSFGAFGVAASLELDDSGSADDVYGLGLTYGAELGGIALGFGLGYQDGGDTYGDIVGVSVDANFHNGFEAVLNYWDQSAGALGGTDNDYIGVALGYTVDALSFTVNYGEFDTGSEGFGLAANYDLGGGAVVQFGYGDTDGGNDTFSLGVAMSF